MAYKLNKTDGSLVVELVDGKLDTTTTDISLIGKNYQGFGESINENFIALLESFANTAAPSKPLRGQLWYDTGEGRLKVYDGTTFRSTDSTIFSATQPTSLVQGDIWINGAENRLYFFDGTDLIPVGPSYTKSQAKSGIETETIKDTIGQNKIIVKLFINGSNVGIWSKNTFTPFPAIPGYGDIKTGFNINSGFSDFSFYGKADSAEKLVSETGDQFTKDSFLSTLDDSNPAGNRVANGTLTFKGTNGIFIGPDNRLNIKKSGTKTLFDNTGIDSDLEFQLLKTQGTGTLAYSAFKFDTANQRLGIFNDSPNATITGGLDTRSSGVVIGTTTDKRNLIVTGDMRIDGDLRVGTVINEEIASLRVADKVIELATPDDSSLVDSSSEYIDGAGIVINTTSGSIDWVYRNENHNWTTEVNINIDNQVGKYKIEDEVVLTKTGLGPSVINSNLTSIGTLVAINVDDINIDNNVITSSNADGLAFNVLNDIAINPGSLNYRNITGVKKPISALNAAYSVNNESADDLAATKGYVDEELLGRTQYLTINTTGFGAAGFSAAGDLEGAIKALLLVWIPTTAITENATVRIVSEQPTATTDPIDVNSNIVKSFLAVDSAGVQNVNVISDVAVSPDPTTTITFGITRHILEFRMQASDWVWVSTVAYP
jgi:hypothetical protein